MASLTVKNLGRHLLLGTLEAIVYLAFLGVATGGVKLLWYILVKEEHFPQLSWRACAICLSICCVVGKFVKVVLEMESRIKPAEEPSNAKANS